MKASVKCKPLLHADGKHYWLPVVMYSQIEYVLIREMESVIEWLVENRLSLHLGKTESILFGFNKRLDKRSELHITCNSNDIESGAKVTYLGVTLDQNFSGSSIVTEIFGQKNKMFLTSALVQCHFDYGSSTWYTGTACLLKKRL